jgi:hypothetical protein
VRINHLFNRSLVASLLLCAGGLLCSAHAQTGGGARPMPQATPNVLMPAPQSPQAVAGSNNLYCSGFIQYAPAPNNLQIVGGEEEQSKRVYAQGDIVYINAGAQQGVQAGQEYIVIRPRGQWRSRLSKKKGWLGVYTQEVGILRVLRIKDQVSVAEVKSSCDNLLLGDLLRAAPTRVAPLRRLDERLDRFADPSGKQTGRIVLARDTQEMLTRDQVVFIDLGSEDNVKPGDYLTIYRPVGKGNITRFRDEEVTPTANSGFESNIFKGGKFSNKAQRVKDANSTGIFGPMVTTPKIQHSRPRLPRKIVGEMIILSVQQRTAAAVITRVAQEVHTGDYVEVQ